MKYSVCYIDDKIPVENFPDIFEDTSIISDSTLKFLLSNIAKWEDSIVQSLIKKLLEQADNIKLCAFKNPSFFFNHIEEDIYSPEIILYDWDYGFGINSEDSERYLLEILKTTFSIVHVYTNADNNGEITQILAKKEFQEFSDRLNITRKEEENSVDIILNKALERWNSNFSYKFGKELFFNAHKSLNNILVDISKLSIKQVVASLGNRQLDGRYSITVNNLIGIISEKFKHQLHEQSFTEFDKPINIDEIADIEIVRKIWNYRLYYSPNDSIVRKGDIVTRKDNETKFLVLSSDCHLNGFWNKNFGLISLVPLHKINDKEYINRHFGSVKKSKLNTFKVTSLTNNSGINDVTILPCILEDNGELIDYLITPKEIFSIYIDLPKIDNIDSLKSNLPLLFDYWPEIDFTKRVSISEPFKSPLIQYVLENISGYGCPDYPDSLQKDLKDKFDDARK